MSFFWNFFFEKNVFVTFVYIDVLIIINKVYFRIHYVNIKLLFCDIYYLLTQQYIQNSHKCPKNPISLSNFPKSSASKKKFQSRFISSYMHQLKNYFDNPSLYLISIYNIHFIIKSNFLKDYFSKIWVNSEKKFAENYFGFHFWSSFFDFLLFFWISTN
jgi:hypothetical protein